MATPSKISIISPQTRFTGEVNSDDILVVAGEVEGEVKSRKVVIKDQGKVLGNITCASLVIEAGGIFDGRAFMGQSQPDGERVETEPD